MAKKEVGGIKGFFLKAGKSFAAGGVLARDWSWWLAEKGGRVGLILASTSMVILMPLIFEINREVTVSVRSLNFELWKQTEVSLDVSAPFS